MKLLKRFAFPLLLFLVFTLAFFLRTHLFFQGDFYYLVDQSRDLLLTESIVQDHKLTLIGPRTGIGGIFHGPLWIYMITPFFATAQGDPFWTLVPLFTLISMAIVVTGFVVGAKLYGKWMGLLFAFFLSISAPLVETVPFTTNAQVTPLVFLLYLFSIIQYLRGKENYLIFALFFIGLGIQFESAFAVLWIPLTLIALILRKKFPKIKTLVFGIGAFVLAVSTFILFDVRHQFLMTSAAFRLLFTPTKPLPGYEQYSDIAFRINDRIASLWTSLFTPLFSDNLATSTLLLIILALGIFFLAQKYFGKKKAGESDKEYAFILLSPLLIYGIYIVYPLPLWEHYLLPISILSIFVLALSIQRIFTKGNPFKGLVALLLFLMLLSPLSWIVTAYQTPYVTRSDGSYKNQLEVATWVLNDAKKQPAGYFVYNSGILTYNMDYLFSWLSRKEGVSPLSNQKQPVTYLILYPANVNDENAHNFWKKNVVKTNGTVIESKKFSSGIIVEKLAIPSDDPAPDPNYYQDVLFR